nr:hypothetical protein CFP56_35269 [Quercus suber]
MLEYQKSFLLLKPLIINRAYHDPLQLIHTVVCYENWTVIDGYHIEGSGRGAIVQLVVQTLQNHINMGRKSGKDFNASLFHCTLTAAAMSKKQNTKNLEEIL